MRGAAAYGNYFQDGTKIVGPAIDEAAQWFEKADRIGLIACPSLECHLELMPGHQGLYPKYLDTYDSVPFKEEKPRTAWVLEWPSYAVEEISTAREEVIRSFGMFGRVIDRQVYPKYRNTLNYFDKATGFTQVEKPK